MTREYYDEENSHDVIFVGDCEVYENFSPVTMWEETWHNELHPRLGAAAYLAVVLSAGGGALSAKAREVVVYNVQSMKYDTPQSEAYNRMTHRRYAAYRSTSSTR